MTILASGEQATDPARFYCSDGCPLPDLASDRFTIVSSTQVELRSLLDGSLIASSPAPDKCDDPEDPCEIANQGGLASDGSYYWSGTSTGISAWDDSGALLLTKSGNYAKKVRVSAAPGELRIALGPAGGNVIERISIDTGASTTSSFAGAFHSWFLDGGRFLTTLNTTVRVYSAATASQEAIVALPQVSRLTGQGDYFWSLGWDGEASTMAIFAVADPLTPAAVYQNVTPYPVANRIAVLGDTEVTIIELDPSGITDSTVDLPADRIERFTSDAAGNWAVGNRWGVVYDGADLERPLSCGQATDIAGSEHGTVAIATFVGILLFDVTPDSRTYLGSIPFPSGDVDLSSDGTMLAAASLSGVTGMGDAALKIFGLPDRSELRSVASPPSVNDVTFSALGNRFAYTASFPASQTVTDLAGNVSFTRSGGQDTRLALSPDGSRVAAPSGTPNAATTTTNIYENGTLIDAFAGYALLWLDQDRLLVNTVSESNNPNNPGGARIYAVPGGFQPGPRLPSLDYADPRMVSSTEVYAEPRDNAVYSLSTGERLWSCDDAPEGQGTVAAGNIVFSTANKIIFTQY